MENRKRLAFKVRSKNQVSLSQRLKSHYENPQAPKDSTMTCMAMFFFWINTVILVLEGMAVVLPSIFAVKKVNKSGKDSYEYTSGFIWAQMATVWLLIGTVFHWWFLRDGEKNIVRKNTKDKYVKTPGTPIGWSRCQSCKIDCPPRSFHCKVCKCCVLKRDHHCYFSGSCVAFHNQRHFVYLLIYITMACSYAVCMQVLYLSKEHPMYFIPFVAMWRTITAQSRKMSLIILFHLYICIIGLFACLSFLGWQLHCILRGQTSHEANKSINTYRQRAYENFLTVFGSPWQCLLAFLLPVRFDLPSDGISWQRSGQS